MHASLLLYMALEVPRSGSGEGVGGRRSWWQFYLLVIKGIRGDIKIQTGCSQNAAAFHCYV